MLRIDRDNLALMRRIEGASSGYKRALVKPKHFQEPHMGLFPRWAISRAAVKSYQFCVQQSPPMSSPDELRVVHALCSVFILPKIDGCETAFAVSPYNIRSDVFLAMKAAPDRSPHLQLSWSRELEVFNTTTGMKMFKEKENYIYLYCF